MTVPEPTYITEAEVKEQTLVTALKNIQPADRTKLIQIAEDQIDSYCGPQRHHPDDTNTDRVFPRLQDVDEDLYAIIPYKVSRATLRQVEFLYREWYSSDSTEALPEDRTVESERIGGDGSYGADFGKFGASYEQASLCKEAKLLLKGFVSRTAGLAVCDPDLAPFPT